MRSDALLFACFLLCFSWIAGAAARARITRISHDGELGVAEPFRPTTLTGHVEDLSSTAARYMWWMEGSWYQGKSVTHNFTQLGYQTVHLYVCTGSCPLRLSAASTWSSSVCANKNSLCANRTVLVQYIRREIRDMALEDWNLLAQTMIYLKNTPQATLTERHGPHAVAWDYMNAQHIQASFNVTCNQGHSTGNFLPYHRLLNRAYERSIQAIQPHLSLPYWDAIYDGTTYNTLVYSPIFSDEYMGTSGVASNGYIVPDGKFGYPNWPTPSAVGYLPQNLHGPYGLMRSPTNLNNATYFTRRMGNMFGFEGTLLWPDSTQLAACAAEADQVQLDTCLRYMHGSTHFELAGGWGASIPDNLSETGKLMLAIEELAEDFTAGILTCDTNCDQSLGTTACVCYCNDTSHHFLDRQAILQSSSICARGMPGEFYDVATSINDPVFPFYHALWDKAWMDYYAAHTSDNVYSGYEDGSTLCTNLDDIVSGASGFSPFTMGWSETDTAVSVTLRQSIDNFLPGVSPYTYKTFSGWNNTTSSSTTSSASSAEEAAFLRRTRRFKKIGKGKAHRGQV